MVDRVSCRRPLIPSQPRGELELLLLDELERREVLELDWELALLGLTDWLVDGDELDSVLAVLDDNELGLLSVFDWLELLFVLAELLLS